MNSDYKESILKNNDEMSLLWFTRAIFYLVLFFVVVVNTVNLYQPILEEHAFRQTQTALTAFYLKVNGFSLQYETPVVGMPWSIPFEFPIYQEIVALASQWLHLPLTVCGRIVSLIFALLTCIPIYRGLRLLKINRAAIYFVMAMYLSAPVYIFWSGTFMIETTATFFTVSFLFYFIKICQKEWSGRTIILAGLFLLCALLQKVTTALPVLFCAGFIWLFNIYASHNLRKRGWKLLQIGLALTVPFVLAYAWVRYSDAIKSLNPIGETMTSKALASWNYGTLDERFSIDFWRRVVFLRVIRGSAFSAFGLIAVIASLFVLKDLRVKKTIGLAFILFLLPFLFFTNLHAVHSYYQTANVLFLSIAVGISFFYLANQLAGRQSWVVMIGMSAFIASNIWWFYNSYGANKFAQIDISNNTVLELASNLKEKTPEGKPIVVYGYGWSSEIPFYAERKALAVHGANLSIDTINNSERYLPNSPPSALVLCPNESIDVIRSMIKSHYKFREQQKVANCEIYYL